MPRASRLAPLVALVALVAWSSAAVRAHGGLPQAHQILRDASGDTLVINATFGLVVSEDRGATWTWVCPDAIPAGRWGTPSPAALSADGTLFVATGRGLVAGDDLGCGFRTSPPELRDIYTTDVVAAPGDGRTLYALGAESGAANRVYRSTDAGAAWSALPAPLEEGFLPERVRIAPSDPDRLYVGGAFPTTPTSDRQAALFRSTDAGALWTRHDFALLEQEIDLLLLAVHPTDPDRLWARVRGELTDRLVTSTDGGASFSEVARLDAAPVPLGRPFGFAFGSDGGLWFGNTVEGLLLSPDGVELWDVDKELAVTCLLAVGDELWVCADGMEDGFAVGRSVAIDAPYVPLLTFADIGAIRACGERSAVTAVCPDWWDDLQSDLGRAPRTDAGMPATDAGAEADAGAPPLDAGRDAASGATDLAPGGGGCGCVVPPGRPAPLQPWVWLAVLGVTVRTARARAARRRGHTARRPDSRCPRGC